MGLAVVACFCLFQFVEEVTVSSKYGPFWDVSDLRRNHLCHEHAMVALEAGCCLVDWMDRE